MDKIKILHTGDVHLDCRFSGIGERGTIRRGELREVFKRIVDTAEEEDVDLLLIAGDLFEHERVSLDTINFVKNELQRLDDIRVFISPGNHDPFVSGSPYSTSDWPDNVYIFQTDKFTPVEIREINTIVYGIANTSFQDRTNHLKDLGIPPNSNDAFNVILMHGSHMQNIPKAIGNDTYFPFENADIYSCGADYIALGHYHSVRYIPNKEKPLACYCGCPEGTGFDEVGSKCVLLVEVTKGKNIVRETLTNIRRYISDYINCAGMTTRQEIIERIKENAQEHNWQDSIVQLTLVGEVEPELELDIGEINHGIQKYFFVVKLVNNTLPKYNLEDLKGQKSTVGEFVRKIDKMLSDLSLDDPERKTLENALYYGLDAFVRQKVTKR